MHGPSSEIFFFIFFLFFSDSSTTLHHVLFTFFPTVNRPAKDIPLGTPLRCRDGRRGRCTGSLPTWLQAPCPCSWLRVSAAQFRVLPVQPCAGARKPFAPSRSAPRTLSSAARPAALEQLAELQCATHASELVE